MVSAFLPEFRLLFASLDQALSSRSRDSPLGYTLPRPGSHRATWTAGLEFAGQKSKGYGLQTVFEQRCASVRKDEQLTWVEKGVRPSSIQGV